MQHYTRTVPKNSHTEHWQETRKAVLQISMASHLDKIRKAFFAGRAGEIAIVDMDGHVIFKQIQAVKGLRTENAGVCFLVHVELHVALERTAVDEALVADVTSQRAVPFPSMKPQVLIQFVLFAEGLPTLEAFERAKGFPYEQVLKSCILKETSERPLAFIIMHRIHIQIFSRLNTPDDR